MVTKQNLTMLFLLCLFMMSLVGCAPLQPITTLSQAKEGKVAFQSPNSASFQDMLLKRQTNSPLTIFGTLQLPKPSGQPVPAAIILHGGGGVDPNHFQVAKELAGRGIASFLVDSYEPRGIRGLQDRLEKINYSMRVSDAYAALRLLSTHPNIDKNRIALIGYSEGGQTALFAASEKIRRSYVNDDLRFAGFALYYPGCFFQLKELGYGKSPILMLLAEKDNGAPAAPCQDYGGRIKESGVDVSVVVYDGAHHGFDYDALSGKVVEMPDLSDVSKCLDKMTYQLQSDGSWFSPKSNTRVEAFPDRQKIIADCGLKGKATVGDPTKVRAKAEKEFYSFLDRVLKAH